MVQPQPGQTGLPSVSGQRRRRNTVTMSPSDIRMILAALSERAAADSRKCWAMPTAAENPASYLPDMQPLYKTDFVGGGCYIRPGKTGLWHHKRAPHEISEAAS